MPSAPTNAELYSKINNAILAVKAGRCSLGTLKHWQGDREALGLIATSELWPVLLVLLEEIKAARPENCYVGGRPPHRCYEDDSVIKGKSLWAFSWDSGRVGKRMYIKFILEKDQRGEWYYYHIDCHHDAPKTK